MNENDDDVVDDNDEYNNDSNFGYMLCSYIIIFLLMIF